MNKLITLLVLLLLISVVGCSSTNTIAGPDASGQIQSNDSVQKPPDKSDPGDDEGDPDSLIDGFEGPR